MDNNKNSFITGMFGGICLTAFIIIILLGCNFHHSIFRPIRIINPEIHVDSINQIEIREKVKEIELLEKKGLILTPQEYTNNIVSYYNSIITLLVTLLALFSVVSFFHLKFIAQDEVKKNVTELLRKSPEIQKVLLDNFKGKIDEVLYDVPEKIAILELKIESLEKIQIKTDIEDESELENLKIKKQ